MPLRRGWVLGLVLVASPVPLVASEGWTSLGPPGGCVALPVLDPQNPSTIYTIDNSGVVKSVDGGFTWKRMDAPPLFTLKIHPAHPNILVGLESITTGLLPDRVLQLIVWRSEDGGESWARKGVAWQLAMDDWPACYECYPKLALDPTSTEIAFIGGCSGVSQTTDGGATWKNLGYAKTYCDVVIGFSPPFVYALSKGWLYTFTVDGSFRSIARGFSCIDVMIGAIFPTAFVVDPIWRGTMYASCSAPSMNLDGVWKSADGGTNWRRTASFAVDGDHPELTISPGNHMTLYSLSGINIVRSTDAGESWRISGSLPTCYPDLVVDPVDSAVLWGSSTGGGLWRSPDAAWSWEARGGGLHGSRSVTALLADPGVTDRLYAVVTGLGLVRSDDRGATWTRVVGTGMTGSEVSDLSPLAIAPGVRPTIFVSTPSGVFASDDGGRTWRLFLNADSLFVDPVQPTTLFARARKGNAEAILRSTDGGKSWQDVLEVGSLQWLAIDASDHNTIIAVAGGGLHLSHDGGSTWAAGPRFAGGVEHLVTDPHASGVYLATPGYPPQGMIRSADGGSTWTAVPGSPEVPIGQANVYSIIFDPCAPGVAFAGTNFGVVKSEDHGVTWQRFNARLNNVEVRRFAFSGDSRTLYAATAQNGVFSVDPGPRVCQFSRVRRHL